jgi:hypothetical protein
MRTMPGLTVLQFKYLPQARPSEFADFIHRLAEVVLVTTVDANRESISNPSESSLGSLDPQRLRPA